MTCCLISQVDFHCLFPEGETYELCLIKEFKIRVQEEKWGRLVGRGQAKTLGEVMWLSQAIEKYDTVECGIDKGLQRGDFLYSLGLGLTQYLSFDRPSQQIADRRQRGKSVLKSLYM